MGHGAQGAVEGWEEGTPGGAVGDSGGRRWRPLLRSRMPGEKSGRKEIPEAVSKALVIA